MIVVAQVEHGRLGAVSGLRPGDRIHRVNGERIDDAIDFHVRAAERDVLLEIERGSEFYAVEIVREPGESFGLSFEEGALRRCNNRCVFCFVRQLPQGLRPSLYVKDDDYRLSFLHGSYVTLTNLRSRDIDRIVAQRLSPQFVSVHATDPVVRQRLLGRRGPAPIMPLLRRLADQGIQLHAQIVLCPGWNDGPHLERTVHELACLHPALRSIALVPVGLTRYRRALPRLRPVTPELAARYVCSAATAGEAFLAAYGERLVYCADELFLLAGQPIPPAEYYGDLPQLENGVGMLRATVDGWERSSRRLAAVSRPGVRIGMVTGTLAAASMREIAAEAAERCSLRVELVVVRNRFFGETVTVSGLLTGGDILKALAEHGRFDCVLLPPNCLNDDGLTLDGMTVADLSARLGMPVTAGRRDLVASLRLAIQTACRQRAARSRASAAGGPR